VLAYTFIGIYLLFWLFSFLNSVSLVEEWRVLTDSRKIVTRRGSVRYADKWNVTHILRSIQFQMMPFRDPLLYEHFVCKPLAPPPDAKAVGVPSPLASAETPEAAKKTRG